MVHPFPKFRANPPTTSRVTLLSVRRGTDKPTNERQSKHYPRQLVLQRTERRCSDYNSGGSTLGSGGGAQAPKIVARPPNLARTLDTLWSINSQKN